jgi:hypothetical protein
MANDEQGTSGVSRMIQAYIDQLHATTEGLQNLARLGGRPPSAPGAPPLPGALSAAQLTAITDGIAAQRRSIEALKAQLSSFDEQLTVLEQLLGPLAQWSKAWADLEQGLLNMGRRPPADR